MAATLELNGYEKSISLAADATVGPLKIQDPNGVAFYSVQIDLSNTDAVGVLYIQGRLHDDGEWVNLYFKDYANDAWANSITVSSGTDVNEIKDLFQAVKQIRVFYDRTSGSGTMNVFFSKRG